jgi:hypothetical protein
MYWIALFLMLCAAPAMAQVPGKIIETLADVPWQLRQPNWDSPKGEGSCVNAATVTLLRWMGLHEHAEWWRTNFQGGEWDTSQINHMTFSGLKFAYTDTGDPAFLDWASRNRLGAGIFYYPRHSINLLDLSQDYAILLDNNSVGVYTVVPREEFLRRWRTEFGGFGWTFVYQPPPPWPAQ